MRSNLNFKAILYLVIFFIASLSISFSVFKPRGFDSDDPNYIRVFNSISFNTPYFLQEMEPMYISISKILHYFGYNYLGILLIFSGLGLFLKFFSLSKIFYRLRSFYLFIFAYFLFLYWFHDITQIRISFSLALFLYATTLSYKNFVKYIFLIFSLLTHYSIFPAIFLLIYRELIEENISPKFRSYMSFILYIFIICFVVYVNSITEVKYGEGNYPSNYYFIHPYSICIFISIILLKNTKKSIFYYLSMFYYAFFVAYLLSDSQIAAFRFIEIAYFFLLIDICKRFDYNQIFYRNIFCLLLTTLTFFSYAFIFSPQVSFDMQILSKWFYNGFGVF